MDVIKITAFLIILISTSLMGAFLGNREKSRINDLDELKKSLEILISEITFASSALPSALINVSKQSNQKFKHFFTYLGKSLSDRQDVEAAWLNACKNKLNATSLANEDREKLKILASSLSGFDKSLLVRSISIMTDYIDSKKAELSKEAEKSGKLFRSLGILSGLLIIVIFI